MFDLDEVQAEYILELRLRRLTRFSRIELETERDNLRAEIEELEAILADPARIRAAGLGRARRDRRAVRHSAAHHAHRGAPRRPPSRSSKADAPSLEIADAPCEVLLSTTGRAIRVDIGEEGLHPPKRRSKHDAIRSRVTRTSRGEVGAITNLGRLIRFTPVDLPNVPGNAIQLAAGAKIADVRRGQRQGAGHRARCHSTRSVPITLGTKQGVVKRVTPGWLPGAAGLRDHLAQAGR